MTMVEWVARAIYAADFGDWDEPMPNPVREMYRQRARAAILAMREPTEAMCEAPQKAGAVVLTMEGHQPLYSGNARQAWTLMIDAALSEDATAPVEGLPS
jgi:hypothetical protein